MDYDSDQGVQMRMITFCLLMGLLLNAQSVPTSHESALPGATGSVEGIVINTRTNGPVSGAKVAIHCMYVPTARTCTLLSTTVTDDQGRFQFSALEPGSYLFIAEAPGFVDAEGGPVATANVKAKSLTRGIRVLTAPAATFEGTVVDEQRKALAGVEVAALLERQSGSHKEIAAAALSVTNTKGVFSIKGLSPGKYFISATEKGLPNVQTGEGDRVRNAQSAKAAQGSTRHSYYPSSSSLEDATPIRLLAGQLADGIMVVIPSHSTHDVSGKVVGVDPGLPGDRGKFRMLVSPRLESNPTSSERSVDLRPDGTFAFQDVPDGRYTLYLFAVTNVAASNPTEMRTQSRKLVARSDFDLMGSNIVNLIVPLPSPISVIGKLDTDGMKSENLPADLSVLMVPIGPGRALGTSLRAKVREDGTFTFPECLPLRYRVVVPVPPEYYLAFVTYNQQDISDKPVDVTRGGYGEIVIRYRKGGGELRGRLGGSDRSAAGAASEAEGDAPALRIVLIPAGYDPEGTLPLVEAPLQKGTVAVKNIRPGRYSVLIVNGFRTSRWEDPLFLRDLEAKGKLLTIEDGTSTDIDLPLTDLNLAEPAASLLFKQMNCASRKRLTPC